MVRIPPGLGHRSVSAFLLLALLTACGGSADGADSDERATVPSAVDPTGAVSTTTTEAPEMTVEEEVEAAYLEAERQFMVFMEDPSLPLADAKQFRTGAALSQLQDAVERRQDLGRFTAYPNGYNESFILETVVQSSDARVLACVQDDAVVMRPDGTVVDDDVVTLQLEAKLVLVDGQWLLASESVVKEWEGRAECSEVQEQ